MEGLHRIHYCFLFVAIGLILCGNDSHGDEIVPPVCELPLSAEVTCSAIDMSGCAANEYCAFSEGSCGEDGGEGVCRKKPEGCFTVYLPVCGCDGKTYPNACDAAAAGVSIRHQGQCAAT